MELERGAVIYRHSISGSTLSLKFSVLSLKFSVLSLKFSTPLWIINVALKKSTYKNVRLKKSAYNKQWVEKVCLQQTVG